MSGDPPEHAGMAAPEDSPSLGKPMRGGDSGAAVAARLSPSVATSPGPENDLWSGRTSWRHFAGRILLWAAACLTLLVLLWRSSGPQAWIAASTALSVSAVAWLFSGLFVFIPILLAIVGNRYRLTSQRFFIHRGVLSETIDQLELVRVDDVRVYKSFINRMMGVGTVTVMSSDSTHREVRVVGVFNPEQLAEAVRSNVKALRRATLHVEQV